MTNITDSVKQRIAHLRTAGADLVEAARNVPKGIAATLGDARDRIPTALARVADAQSVEKEFGTVGDLFKISFQQTRAGQRLKLESIRPIEYEGISDSTAEKFHSVRSVDSMTFLLSPSGEINVPPIARHHLISNGFEKTVAESEKGNTAAKRISAQLREELETFGMEFLRSIGNDELALNAAYALADAHSVVAFPEEHFGKVAKRVPRSNPEFALANPFADFASALEAKLNPVLLSPTFPRAIPPRLEIS